LTPSGEKPAADRGGPQESPGSERGTAEASTESRALPPRPAAVTDATEDELEDRMLAADLADNETLRVAYQRRLEAHRAARAAGKVTPIASARGKR
jgi:hypothetical protein